MPNEILSVFMFFIRCFTCLICNVALKRQTNHSSMYFFNTTLNGASCNAVDGLGSTDFFSGSCFHVNDVDPYPWMQIDVEHGYDIKYVNFSLREDNLQFAHYQKLSNITIQVSNTITSDGALQNPSTCANYLNTPSLADVGKQIQINCNTSVNGRYVRVSRLTSHYMQFCEILIFADIAAISKCPLPTQSWTCRDLCYDADRNSNSCHQDVTTTINADTSWAKTTTTINADTSWVKTTRTTINVDTSWTKTTSNIDTSSTKTTTSSIDSSSTQTTKTGNTDSSTEATSVSSDCFCPCLTRQTGQELVNYISQLINEMRINKKETTLAKSRRISARDSRMSSRALGMVGIIVIVCSVSFLVFLDCISLYQKATKPMLDARYS